MTAALSFDFMKDLRPAPALRPMMNIGCLFDIPTGRYYLGKYGESILNGGIAHLTGIGGRGNTFKSTIMFFMILRALERYAQSVGHVYDTEMSLTLARLQELCEYGAPSLFVEGLEESQRLSLTDKTVYDGTEWFDMLKTATKERAKHPKDQMGVTPFLDKEGKAISYLFPFLVGVDSLSLFNTANVVRIQQENDIGDSGRNTEALRDGGAKTQFVSELPTMTARNGIYMLLSAHMGDEFQLDPRATPQKKLAFLKQNVKFKNTPEKFTFLMNNCWWSVTASPMMTDDKVPEFPRDKDDSMKGDTDLMRVQITQLRGKNGPTGMALTLVVSQSEGVLPSLSEFLYIKENGRYGFEGNLQNFSLALLPDVNLSRTTVRRKINENARLRRALEIQSEMLQMEQYWHDVPAALQCTPKQLYDDLKAKGYNWDQLLDTRGYWVFDNDKHPVPFLSTMDLMNMRAGLYHPYWMAEKPTPVALPKAA